VEPWASLASNWGYEEYRIDIAGTSRAKSIVDSQVKRAVADVPTHSTLNEMTLTQKRAIFFVISA
jgi:hypothetical protein